MITGKGNALLHSVSDAQCEHLETVFAFRTEEGWIIPAWLLCLRYERQLPDRRPDLRVSFYAPQPL